MFDPSVEHFPFSNANIDGLCRALFWLSCPNFSQGVLYEQLIPWISHE